MRDFLLELKSLAKSEKLFVFWAMIAGFCISAEYAATRPVSQSIFLSVFTASAYPYFWLATIPLNLTIVSLYSHYLPRLGPLKTMMIVTVCVMGIHTLTYAILPFYPKFIFFHFCWKDVYVLLMFKQLWSMVHSTITSSKAKYLIGMILGMGMCGGVVGSLIPGFLAPVFGSAPLLLSSIPIYSLLLCAYIQAYRYSGAAGFAESIESKESSASAGFRLIAQSRYLFGVLLLVVFMQISVALFEFRFSHELEMAIPVQDLRTAFFGKFISSVNFVCVGLQFFGGLVMLKILGLRGSHLFIPVVLCMTTVGQWLVPGFAMATFAFGCAKSLDYSLFGVVREMLFVPLKLDEKFRAKAVIDVFAHRTSKGLASLILMGLQLYVGSNIFALTHYLLVMILLGWVAVVIFLFKKTELQSALNTPS